MKLIKMISNGAIGNPLCPIKIVWEKIVLQWLMEIGSLKIARIKPLNSFVQRSTQLFNGVPGKNGVPVQKLVVGDMKQELEPFNNQELLYHLAKNVRDKRIENVILNRALVSDFKRIILWLDHHLVRSIKFKNYSFLANCIWNEWEKWGLCSTTCGGGQQLRSRTKLQIAQNGGQECPGTSQDWPRTCNDDLCPSEYLVKINGSFRNLHPFFR